VSHLVHRVRLVVVRFLQHHAHRSPSLPLEFTTRKLSTTRARKNDRHLPMRIKSCRRTLVRSLISTLFRPVFEILRCCKFGTPCCFFSGMCDRDFRFRTIGILAPQERQHRKQGKQWCIAHSAPGTPCTKYSSSLGARRRPGQDTTNATQQGAGVLARVLHCSKTAVVPSCRRRGHYRK